MEIIGQLFLLVVVGVFAIGSSILVAEDKQKKIDRYMKKLPKRREEVSDTFQKKPLTAKGQFDKQRTTYTDGDNT
jgi:hypothetical protein